MIQAYKKKTSVAGTVCVVAIILAVIIASIFDPKQSQLVSLVLPLLSLIAGVAFIAVCWFHIKARGRSGWWILVLVFNLLGLLILMLLKDRATGSENKVA